MAGKLNANSSKALANFVKEYGQQVGTQRFYQTINAHRRDSPGDKLLRALGSQTDRGAASGGRGHEHTKPSVAFRAKNTPSSVTTRHPVHFKKP